MATKEAPGRVWSHLRRELLVVLFIESLNTKPRISSTVSVLYFARGGSVFIGIGAVPLGAGFQVHDPCGHFQPQPCFELYSRGLCRVALDESW